jgi:Tfp pilus assembly protein PilF
LGPEHPQTILAMNNLADVMEDEGYYVEAERLLRQALEVGLRVLGPEHPHTAVTRYNLGCVAAKRGRRNEAISLLRQAVDHGLSSQIDLGIEKDSDLKSLHGDPRFDDLVAHAKERAAIQKAN